MSEFLILRPWWLFALLPITAAAVWVRRSVLAGEWSGLIDPPLLAALRRMGALTEGRHDATLMLPFVVAALAAMALSGPALLRPGAVEYRALDPLVMVLDLSPSVTAASDGPGGALGDLQGAAAALIAGAGGRPVGMMVYAADAYLASAPTRDARSLESLIAVLDDATMPVTGSRPDIALSMAGDLFGDAEGPGIGGTDLVLISDGGGAGPRATEEASRLAAGGARVWALTLDRTADGAPPPEMSGLDAMARAGGGATFPAANVEALTDRIAAVRTARLIRDDRSGASLRDFGPWLLLLALPPAALLFRRRR